MSELDALEQLSNLLLKIEKNNWEGIYRVIESENELPFTPRTYRQEKEINNLKDKIRALEIENQTQRIKLGAVNNILNGDSDKNKTA